MRSFGESGMAQLPLGGAAYHLLLDRAENRMAVRMVHFDADAVTITEERCLRCAMQDRLDRAHFGDARIAEATVADRLPRPAVRVAVRHRAGADDHAAPERARFGGMRNEPREVER